MGKTTPTTSVLLHKERSELGRFRRALRKEDQQVFDELWTYVSHHMMACTVADHLLPFETFLLTMTLEQQKEIRRLKAMIAQVKRSLDPNAALDGLPLGYCIKGPKNGGSENE